MVTGVLTVVEVIIDSEADASHLVQMVLVDVIKIVLVEIPTLVLVTPLEVCVAVTGQIVVDV